jgi:CIC family chloride channel protein
VFELTRNYELTTAVMVSVVFSNVVAYRLFGRSLFDRQLALAGCDLSLGRDKLVLQRTAISDHVTTDAVTLQQDESLLNAQRAMIAANRQECYVLDELGHYLGKIRLYDIVQLNNRLDLEAVQNHAAVNHLHLRHDQSVWDAMEKMREFVGESIPVIDQRGYFIGIVYEATLVTAYLAAIANIRAEQHAA